MEAIEQVLDHGQVLLGPEVPQFESEVAHYCGTKYAIGVGSGSIALYFALKAANIGPGDEVITSCLSFVGTANAIAMTGAKPVFVDTAIDLTIDPVCISAAIGERTKAIMPVHFTGRLCGMDIIKGISESNNICIIEDAAPAFGASNQAGQKAGSFGMAGCLSINPMKVLNALGEAGIVLTDDEILKNKVMALRYNGLVNRESCEFISTNGRIDTIQAAVARVRLRNIDTIITRRNKIANYYNHKFKGLFILPEPMPNCTDVFYTYTLQTEQRDQLADYLTSNGIECKIQHPILMPEHLAFKEDNIELNYPVAKRATREILCIPANETLNDLQVEYVATTIRRFFKGRQR
jgi:dTDP-4-amino-4,6-dideoxygalactose transaminase